MGELDLIKICFTPTAVSVGQQAAIGTIFYAGPLLALLSFGLRRVERTHPDRLWPAEVRSWCQVALAVQWASLIMWLLFTPMAILVALFRQEQFPWLAATAVVLPCQMVAIDLWHRTLTHVAPPSLPSITS